MERGDRTAGIVLVHSIGGGTGSGLGSRLVKTVRDEFPRSAVTRWQLAGPHDVPPARSGCGTKVHPPPHPFPIPMP
jgi:hypothetical protein